MTQFKDCERRSELQALRAAARVEEKNPGFPFV